MVLLTYAKSPSHIKVWGASSIIALKMSRVFVNFESKIVYLIALQLRHEADSDHFYNLNTSDHFRTVN